MKNFMIIWIVFFIYNEKAQKCQRKNNFFFATPSFSEKLLFFIFFHAVKNPLLIVKNFDFLALLDNKFFTTAETPEILAPLHYTLDIYYIIYNI